MIFIFFMNRIVTMISNAIGKNTILYIKMVF